MNLVVGGYVRGSKLESEGTHLTRCSLDLKKHFLFYKWPLYLEILPPPSQIKILISLCKIKKIFFFNICFKNIKKYFSFLIYFSGSKTVFGIKIGLTDPKCTVRAHSTLCAHSVHSGSVSPILIMKTVLEPEKYMKIL